MKNDALPWILGFRSCDALPWILGFRSCYAENMHKLAESRFN